jgi:hypothetical protein
MCKRFVARDRSNPRKADHQRQTVLNHEGTPQNQRDRRRAVWWKSGAAADEQHDGTAVMGILRPLRRLLGLSGIAGRKEKDMCRLLLDDPEPIQLPPSQWEQVEKRIADFVSDSSSVYAHAYAAIARVNALSLFFDWTAFMALRPDGQLVWVPYDDESGDTEVVRKESLRNLGLFQATRLHPDLQFPVPSKPPDALDCPACRGTGKQPFPEGSKLLFDKMICSYAAVGWLPHSEKP